MRSPVVMAVALVVARSEAAQPKCADVEADHKAAEAKTKAACEAAVAALR